MTLPFRRKLTGCLLALLAPAALVAQTEEDLLQDLPETRSTVLVQNTFNGLWNVNLPTTEVVGKGDIAFSIVHRFGDIDGPESKGIADLWGLDFVRDYRLSLDYGLTDRWMVGIGRSKQQSRFDFNTRYQFLRQAVNGMPISLSAHVIAAIASETNTFTPTGVRYYESSSDRWDYLASITIARKFGRFSAAITPMYHYRMRVQDPLDENGQFAIGLATRILVGKNMALTADYVYNTSPFRTEDYDATPFRPAYFQPFGVGYEVAVGGHIFQLHVTNNVGVLPNAYLVNNSYSYEDGRYRFGFLLKRVLGTKRMKELPPNGSN